MTPAQFFNFSDRLAQQYGLLNSTVATLSVPAVTASTTTGSVVSNTAILWTAVTTGFAGNSILIHLVNPGTPSAGLTVVVVGTTVTVNLATDGSSIVTSTPSTIIPAIVASCAASGLVTATSPNGSTGLSAVSAANVYLTGGTHGLYNNSVVATNDETAVLKLAGASQNLDNLLTTDILVQNAVLFTLLTGALRTYFSAVGQANLIDGFLTANNVRVHQWFDQIHYLTTNAHLLGANVFQAVSQNVATITTQGISNANVTLQPTGSKATLTTGSGGTTIVWNAVTAGVDGNAITVQYVNPLTNSAPLWVEVEGNVITVHLATDGGGALTSTVSQVVAAVAAHGVASTLVTSSSSGSSVIASTSVANLSNLDTAVKWTAVNLGALGNLVTVHYVVSGVSTSLTVSVTNYAITVNVATDGSGNPTTTATALVTYVMTAGTSGTLAATALAVPSLVATGLNVVSAVSATSLFGGGVPVLTSQTPLGTGTGAASAGNYAAQNFQISLLPNIGTASLLVYPSGAYAVLTTGAVGTNNDIEWTAVTAGITGNIITIQYVYTQIPSTTLNIAVSGSIITITLATNAASAITTTATALVAAIPSSPANTLVSAATTTGSGILVEMTTPSYLSNTNNKILFTYAGVGGAGGTAGTAGNAVSVQYVVSGTSTSLSVGVTGPAITVNVATDGSGKPTTTAAQLLTFLTTSGSGGAVSARALATATIPGGGSGSGVVAAYGPTNLAIGDGPNSVRTTTLALTLLRSDLAIVTRNVTFTSGTVPNTVEAITTTQASLAVGTGNAAFLLTAASGYIGTAGNVITIVLVGTGTPGAALATTISGTAITVQLAIAPNGTAYSTASDVVASINGSASSLVTAALASNSLGYGIVTALTVTSLAGGTGTEMYYGVNSVGLVTGGEPGDVYTVSSIVERTVSL